MNAPSEIVPTLIDRIETDPGRPEDAAGDVEILDVTVRRLERSKMKTIEAVRRRLECRRPLVLRAHRRLHRFCVSVCSDDPREIPRVESLDAVLRLGAEEATGETP